ncbi:MAG: cyclic nucleotide-binding domain-containing protein [Candidatus Omnitrophica bacterium]|nr:cyclic nucleotide-binding domain-containing protein [Candidatus Omnitrophota bacterium]
MELINKESILKDIALFAGLSSRQQALIREKIRFQEYKKGQVIYEEASGPSAFYCLILGRVVLSTKNRLGEEIILEYLHRGKYFGIISLLTGEPHSVTAKALNDCLILIVEKADFDLILKKIPRLAIDLSRSLSRRLKNKDIHQKTIFESTIISIFSSYSQAGKTIYALNLALSLNKETHKSAVILDVCPQDKTHSLFNKLDFTGDYPTFNLSLDSAELGRIKDFILKSRFGLDLICLSYKPQDKLALERLIGILSLLVNDYHYILLDLPSLMEPLVFSMLNQSDLIHVLTSPEPVDLSRTRNLIERLKLDFGFDASKINVLINEYKLAKISGEEQLGLLGQPIFATLPKIELGAADRLILDDPDCEYAKAIRRISRQAGDCLVGLALGVGFAYGLCHIGVLKVIEEEKIPIDVISGSSIGALIACLWAIGKTSDEILEITKELREPKYIWGLMDLTFPLIGFIKGKKIYGFLRKHLGNKTFHDVKLPLRIIASDFRRKEPRIMEKGLLADAIMASCAMPGVFMPFRLKGEMLVDGGVISPLPTGVLFKMGVKKIIAVNVTPSHEDIIRQREQIKEKIATEALEAKKHFSLKRFFGQRLRVNILDIIFSSIEVMQSEMIQKEAQLADIVLHPELGGIHWLELHRSRDFAKRGEEEARRNLARIWQIINE